MHLTWSWPTFFGIVAIGVFVGYFVWPYAWPQRMADRIRPPETIILAVAIGTVFAFGFFLAVLRLATIGIAELQASVLLIVYVIACSAGLGIRTAPWK